MRGCQQEPQQLKMALICITARPESSSWGSAAAAAAAGQRLQRGAKLRTQRAAARDAEGACGKAPASALPAEAAWRWRAVLLTLFPLYLCPSALQRSWRKVRAQLFAASPSGVARMEKFDVRDEGKMLDKSSLRRCARRVIRLSDCVSVGPAGAESCPKATAAFYLTTTEKSYVLAAEQRDEWIEQLCQLAFQVPPAPLALLPAPVSPGGGRAHLPLLQGTKQAAPGSAKPQPSPDVPMEENSLYSSRQDRTCGSGAGVGSGWAQWS